MRRLVVTFADSAYLIGVVGLLESIRVHCGPTPDFEFLLWYQETPVKKAPGRALGPTPIPSLFRSKVQELRDVQSMLLDAYPFVHVLPISSIPDVQMPEHAFYMKAAIVRATVDMFRDEQVSCLYLDTDCLVNGPIDQLWDLIAHDFFLLGPDPDVGRITKFAKQWGKFLGTLVLKRAYGCAGVLGFNNKHSDLLHTWEVVTAKLAKILIAADYAEDAQLVFGGTDQDAINFLTAAQSFSPRNQRMVVSQDLVDFQRNFYKKFEPKVAAIPDPMRLVREDEGGHKMYQASIIHCYDKWWKYGCITPVKTAGFYYQQLSSLSDCFEYRNDGWLPGDRNELVGPQGDTSERTDLLPKSAGCSEFGVVGSPRGVVASE